MEVGIGSVGSCFYSKLPEGTTPIWAIRLSGVRNSESAIARAILADPAILLLDEATKRFLRKVTSAKSALDKLQN